MNVKKNSCGLGGKPMLIHGDSEIELKKIEIEMYLNFERLATTNVSGNNIQIGLNWCYKAFPQIEEHPVEIIDHIIIHEILELLDVDGDLHSINSIRTQAKLSGIEKLERKIRNYHYVYEISI